MSASPAVSRLKQDVCEAIDGMSEELLRLSHAIHANPDYMHWYGWGPMKSSLQRIKEMAVEYRKRHAK